MGVASGVVVRIGSLDGVCCDRSGYQCEDVSGGDGKLCGFVAALHMSSGMMWSGRVGADGVMYDGFARCFSAIFMSCWA